MQSSLKLNPKLQNQGTTIFTVMSKLAQEHDAINLGQGFPDFDAHPKLLDLVSRYVHEGKNQYSPVAGLPSLLEVISGKIATSYGMKINPESQLCVTAGATQALFTAITALIQKNDEVIVIEPAFDCYVPQIVLSGGIPVPYAIKYPDYQIDWDEFEKLVSDKTRMIIINTPHNPTGTILEKDDIASLERIVSGRNIVVLSDEVYEHIIFDGEEHQSVLRFPALFQQSMAVFSFGKALHTTGWKLGYIVGPENLMREFKSVHQWNVFCVNSFLQHAIAEYFQTAEHYERLPDFFQAKRDHMLKLFKDLPLKPLISKGTYYQVYNYEEASELSDIEFAKYLTTELGVASIPMSPFYTDNSEDKVIRLCFAKRLKTMEAASKRLSALLK